MSQVNKLLQAVVAGLRSKAEVMRNPVSAKYHDPAAILEAAASEMETALTFTKEPEFFLYRKNVMGNSGDKVFLVTGRVAGEDDDSAHLIRAEDEQQALSIFNSALTIDHGLDGKVEAYLKRRYGEAIILVDLSQVGEVVTC